MECLCPLEGKLDLNEGKFRRTRRKGRKGREEEEEEGRERRNFGYFSRVGLNPRESANDSDFPLVQSPTVRTFKYVHSSPCIKDRTFKSAH